MSYFVYQISHQQNSKQLRQLCEYAAFKEAKQYARAQRAKLSTDEDITIQIIFAESQEEAEARLREERTAPILREWEK